MLTPFEIVSSSSRSLEDDGGSDNEVVLIAEEGEVDELKESMKKVLPDLLISDDDDGEDGEDGDDNDANDDIEDGEDDQSEESVMGDNGDDSGESLSKVNPPIVSGTTIQKTIKMNLIML